MNNEQRDDLLIDLAESLEREDALIKGRDDYRAALELVWKTCTITGTANALVSEALAKYPREDEVEQARRMV